MKWLRNASWLAAAVCAAALVGPWLTVGAQSNESGNAYRIAVVDRKAALAGYTQFQNQMKALSAEAEAVKKDINQRVDKASAAKDAYEKERENLSEEDRDKRELALTREFNQIQTDSQTKNGEIEARGASLLKKTSQELGEAVKGIAESGNYHLILCKDEPAVAWCATSIDITPAVIEKLNQKK